MDVVWSSTSMRVVRRRKRPVNVAQEGPQLRPFRFMSITEEQLEQALAGADIEFRRAARSFVVRTCPKCNGHDKVMAFRDGGNGRCLKCGWSFNAIQLLMEAGGCSTEQARKLLGLVQRQVIQQGRLDAPALQLDTQLIIEAKRREPPRMTLPDDCIGIEHEYITGPGIRYLGRRGVSVEMAKRHDLHWWPSESRVVIPVYDGGRVCRGWQARDTTGKARLKITSPAGFTKALTLMGYECLDRSRDWIILSEGPFDFLRLDLIGNSVCSMGAEVSADQINMIRELDWVRRVYLALDPDAFLKIDRIRSAIGMTKEVFLMQPPVDRQMWLDPAADKSDFGNTTDEGIWTAFRSAYPYSHLRVVGEAVLKIPSPWKVY